MHSVFLYTYVIYCLEIFFLLPERINFCFHFPLFFLEGLAISVRKQNRDVTQCVRIVIVFEHVPLFLIAFIDVCGQCLARIAQNEDGFKSLTFSAVKEP